jgi:2-iminobutanoate/2-iminopropanoate deaminase
MKAIPFTAADVPLSAAMEVGDFLFLSGQVAYRDGKLCGETIEEQTGVAIDAIEVILAQAGLDLGNVVKTTVWLTNAADFPRFNAAYRRRFAPPFPARSTVVSALALSGAMIEIEVIASRSQKRGVDAVP